MASKTTPSTIRSATDSVVRCWWCDSSDLYRDYHDDEWGMPVSDDQRLFEKMCLEGFQAGLSWITILKKRESFRRCFKDFEIAKVARFREATVDKLVQDASIIRHRGKIESTINNAKQAQKMIKEFGSLAAFFWSFEPAKSPKRRNRSQIPAVTDESTALSKELKRRGWSFVGPTTCYALMQAMGMMNDHIVTCESWQRVETARTKFKRPTPSRSPS